MMFFVVTGHPLFPQRAAIVEGGSPRPKGRDRWRDRGVS
jgi:hypothetical protein